MGIEACGLPAIGKATIYFEDKSTRTYEVGVEDVEEILADSGGLYVLYEDGHTVINMDYIYMYGVTYLEEVGEGKA